MALVLYDRVQQTGTANTTVSFTLSGSVTGYQSFSVVGNGNTTYYGATDSSGNWEVGIGTYSTTGPTLTRTTVLSSSNSGSAVTFSGTVNVFITYPAAESVNGDGTTIQAPSGTSLPVANGGTGVTAASITAFNNITGYTATGATGTTSTNLVFSTNPSFSGITATGSLQLTSSTTSTVNLGTSNTTGVLTIGGTAGTGTITIGRSTASQTTNIQAGATASGSTKAINIGTAGLSGSTTNITIGSAVSGATSNVTVNGLTTFTGTYPTSTSDVIQVLGSFGSAVATANSFISRPDVPSGTSLADLFHFSAFPQTNTYAGGSVNQYGFFVNANLTGATSNYGFYGDIPSGSGRWNAYMGGTANNYFAGNVGIGTSAPSTLLHISGTATTAIARIANSSSGATTFDGSGAGLEILASGMNTTSKYTPAIKFGSTDPDFTTTNPKFGAAILAEAVQTYSTDTAGGMNLLFWTSPATPGTGSGLVERMRITSSGNVGINGTPQTGVSAQVEVLQVLGTDGPTSTAAVKRYSADTGSPNLRTYKSRSSSIGTDTIVQSGDGTGAWVGYGYDGSAYINTAQIRMEVDGTPGTNDMPGRITFNTTADGASAVTERMRIDSSGNVGIGTSAPAAVLQLKAGTATANTAPLKFTSGTNLTTPEAGAVEYDGTVFYGDFAASARGVFPAESIVVLNTAYTLTSQTAAQQLFNNTASGALTLPAGTYQFECGFTLTSMSSTSGSFGFALGGSATFTQQWRSLANKPASFTTITNGVLLYNTAANTTLVTANTNTQANALIRGIINITVGGTIIPQVSLGVAAAAVVGVGSYFKISPISGTSGATNITVGNWS